jgi:hypothetical protein
MFIEPALSWSLGVHLDLETRHQLVQRALTGPQPYARSGNNRNKVIILLGKDEYWLKETIQRMSWASVS